VDCQRIIFSFCIAVSLGISVSGEDWPARRGPNANGISKETQWSVPDQGNGIQLLWKTNVGVGFSAVTTEGNKVFTMGNLEGTESIYCLDRSDGRVLWQHSYDCPIDDRFFEGGPTSTPTIDGGMLFALSRQGDLFCLETATGRLMWSQNVHEKTGLRIPGWGFSASPVVDGERLLLGVGESGVMLDRRTGSVVWKSNDADAGYMTPQIFERDSKRYAIIASGKHYQCVDLETGHVQWKHRWLTTYGCNAADPIIDGNRLFISSGYGRGASLLKCSQDRAEVIWSNKEMQNQLNSSVLIDGSVYGFDGDEGSEVLLKCIDIENGTLRWQAEGLGAGSLTAADNKLIILSESGDLIFAPVSPNGFNPSAKIKVLEGRCWTVPVLSYGRIYCRNAAGDLACIDVEQRKKENP
jgi:outer membrane protein assembly factor BamB